MGLRVVMGTETIDGVRCQYRDCTEIHVVTLGQTITDLRDVLREQGWLSVDDVDVCPAHRTRA